MQDSGELKAFKSFNCCASVKSFRISMTRTGKFHVSGILETFEMSSFTKCSFPR